MLNAILKCQACGTTFTVDLDRGDTCCPKCGCSTTRPSSTDTSKQVLS